MIIVSREMRRKERPQRKWRKGFNLADHLREVKDDASGGGKVYEFIGAKDFNKAFYERQRYEVDAGRDQEPVLYDSIYSVVTDSSLPKNISVYRLGPGGVIFEEVKEGGEVKFATVGESNFTIPLKRYAFGLEYNDTLVEFNEVWSMALVERQAGQAYNALLNHVHFTPILNFAYGSDNKTDGTTITFDSNEKLAGKYLRTLENAITHGTDDATNPRRGPYALMCSTRDYFTWLRALSPANTQNDVTTQTAEVLGLVSNIIVYNGWSGTRGKKTVQYSGVTAGKSYLIDLSLRERHFQSYFKYQLRSRSGNPNVSKFVLDQTVWDTWFGVYADPAGAVEEITLPNAS